MSSLLKSAGVITAIATLAGCSLVPRASQPSTSTAPAIQPTRVSASLRPTELALDAHHVGPDRLPANAYFVERDLTRLFGKPPDRIVQNQECGDVTRMAQWGDFAVYGAGSAIDQKDLSYTNWRLTGSKLPIKFTVAGGMPFGENADQVSAKIGGVIDMPYSSVIVPYDDRDVDDNNGIFQFFDNDHKITTITNALTCGLN